jgi:O-antigen ligase
MFLNGNNQLRSLGLLLCAAFLTTHACNPRRLLGQLKPLAPEIKCYLIWVVWACLTGYWVAPSRELFWSATGVLLQMAVLVGVAFATMVYRPHAIPGVWMAVIAGGMVQIVYVVSGVSQGTAATVANQVLGLTSNPNGLGFTMVWTALSLLFFWNIQSRVQPWIRAISLALLIPIGYVIAISGSRKSLLVFGFLVAAWAVFASSARRNSAGILARLTIIGGVVIAGYFALPLIMEHSIVGERFAKLTASGDGSIQGAAESNARYWMYVDGFTMFREHPVCGVGLNNFGYYFPTGQYSHSDYMEPLATTGLPGFILYQSFYVFVILRAFRLMRVVQSPNTLHHLKMIVIGIGAIMLIGIGAPHYGSQKVFILLTTFSAYTLGVSRFPHSRAAPNRASARRRFPAKR